MSNSKSTFGTNKAGGIFLRSVAVWVLLSMGAGGSRIQPAYAAMPTVQAQTPATGSIFLPMVWNSSCPDYTGEPDYRRGFQPNLDQIHTPAAWRNCQFGEGIIVAVIDSGVNLTHTDLAANLLGGKDYVGDDSYPWDENGHGTHVSGIVAAALNNLGMLGVAPQAKILPLRVLDADGRGYTSDVAEAIGYAVGHGAKVINLSLGGTQDSTTLYQAVQNAARNGVLVIAAGGNEYQDGNPVEYPAAYNSYVLAVASVTPSGGHSAFSNAHSYIDIAAPGEQVYSTYTNDEISYYWMSGTSMATPHVSGLAALIWGANPTLSLSQVRGIIEDSATDLGSPGKDNYFGEGLINVEAALGMVSPADLGSSQALVEETEMPVFSDDRQAEINPGVILVSFSGAEVAEPALQRVGAGSLEPLEGLDGYYMVRVTPGEEWTAIDELRGMQGVLSADPDYLVSLQ